jgi:hypothetical protein
VSARGFAAAAGLAALVAAPSVAALAFAHTMPPRKIAEECLKMSAGQTIAYAFEASAPVDFNIHYHRGKDVFYPVKDDGVARAEARFTAPAADEYCLMWTNSQLQPVTVKGRLAP